MANVFSGVLPLFKVFPNSNLNVLAKSAAYPAFNFALSKVLGGQLANKLGLSPTGNSNFLSTIVSPGLLSTGTEGLSQLITSSVRNSKALGPFGQLAGNILQSQVDRLGGIATNTLFGGVPNNPTLYFPGAGGPGEGEANFPKVDALSLGASSSSKQLYATSGGPDVVFAIVPATDGARYIAGLSTVKQPAPTSQPSPGPATPGTPPNDGTLPAANSPTPAPTPVQVVPSSGNPGVNPAPSNGTGQTTEQFLASGVAVNTPGVSPDSRTFPLLPESASGTPEATQAIASQNVATQSAGVNTGVPAVGSTTSGTSAGATPAQTPATEVPPVPAWKFICPPEDISWETTFQADRVPIFGMNDAPVVGGTKSMRDLTLNNAIVEGFTRGKTVEEKIILLENMMRMKMVAGAGQASSTYMQIPVYKVYAGSKPYGNGGGYNERDPGGVYEAGFFIIKSIKVQEKMRDLDGRTTRALVDISLTQVPAYQVETGRDQASAFLPSQRSVAGVVADKVIASSGQLAKDVSAAAAKNGVNGQAGQSGGTGAGGGRAAAGSGERPPAARPGSPGRIQAPRGVINP